MKKLILKTSLLFCLVLTFSACEQDENVTGEEIPADVLQNIERLGFSADGVFREKELGGYIIEGDIHITEEELNSVPQEIRVPNEEQYHTFNLVSGTPRTIGIYVDRRASAVGAATDEAIARYNAENLNLTFTRVNKKKDADITVSAAPRNAGYLASAGFPTSQGNPHNSVKVNVGAVSGQPLGTIASIMAHEFGHCIGFRHTDWFDRSISCGGNPVNEGQQNSGVGAVHIPNTPTGATFSKQSFMLSCIGSGQNRPFNNDDQTALDYLY